MLPRSTSFAGCRPNKDAAHNAPERFVANPGEPCQGYVIRLTVQAGGGIAILNGRNGWEKANARL